MGTNSAKIVIFALSRSFKEAGEAQKPVEQRKGGENATRVTDVSQ